jgi:cytochrome P450
MTYGLPRGAPLGYHGRVPAPTAPGPTGLQMLRQLGAIQRNPLEFLLHCARAYGDLVQFPVGQLPVYFLNHPDAIKHVLQDNHRNYTKNTVQFNTLALVTGQGLLTSDGDVWLRQRRLMQPAFHRQRVAGFGREMTAAAERMLARWEALPPGTALDVDAEMMTVTLEVVGRTLFSADLSREAGSLVPAVLTALDYIVHRAQTPLAFPLNLPTPRNRRFQAALKTLDAVVYALITERRRTGQARDDVLALLLEARDEGQGMTDQQLRDEIITLIIAGHETVASALTWTWHLLAQHPECEERLWLEVVSTLAGRLPAVDDLPNLAYTRMLFDEALRLYPPAWLITRRSLAPDRVMGQALPANALVIISPYVIHRHPGFWPDAERFDPLRFAPERQRDLPRFAYLPFGGGPRQCIGNTFALVEGALILAAVVQRFRLRPPPAQSVHVEPLVTLRPKGGLPMTLERRAEALKKAAA